MKKPSRGDEDGDGGEAVARGRGCGFAAALLTPAREDGVEEVLDLVVPPRARGCRPIRR